MSDTGGYKKNDLVWAKMKGFSPWPGKISDPPIGLGKAPKKSGGVQCIYFFGSKNYAWIDEANIKPYVPFREELNKTSRTVAFRDAVGEIEEYIRDPEKFESEHFNSNSTSVEDEFNKLRDKSDSFEETSSITTPIKKSPKKKEEKKLKSILVKHRTDTRETASLPAKRKRESSISNTSVGGGRKRFLSDDHFATPSTSRKNDKVGSLLNRPIVPRPEAYEISMDSYSENLKKREINPSKLKFGFLGLGIMGGAIVKNLIKSGHTVVVWNRTATKCNKFMEAGAQFGRTPSDVIEAADITFSCVADPQASKDMVFGNCGVLSADSVSLGKGYVELSTIDPETSQDIADAIVAKGGRYLEVQLQGSKPQAEEGELVILAAGDRSLFNDCHSCFRSMARNSFFMGEVGNACKINLIVQSMIGVSLVGVAEAMSLAERAGVSLKDVLDVVQLTTFSSGIVLQKGKEMLGGDFTPQHPLAHMQKDLRLALSMAETLDHSMPTTAISNEVYKHAKRLGYGEHDASAVYVRARF